MNYLTLLLLIGLITSCANNPIKDLFAKNSTVEKQSGSPSENAPSESVEFDEETGETFEEEQKEIEKDCRKLINNKKERSQAWHVFSLRCRTSRA